MFEYLFQQLGSIRDNTELLEACNWDENRAQEVREIYFKSIAEIASSKVSFKTADEIKSHVRGNLSKSLAESEINILERLLDREVLSFKPGDIKDEEN